MAEKVKRLTPPDTLPADFFSRPGTAAPNTTITAPDTLPADFDFSPATPASPTPTPGGGPPPPPSFLEGLYHGVVDPVKGLGGLGLDLLKASGRDPEAASRVSSIPSALADSMRRQRETAAGVRSRVWDQGDLTALPELAASTLLSYLPGGEALQKLGEGMGRGEPGAFGEALGNLALPVLGKGLGKLGAVADRLSPLAADADVIGLVSPRAAHAMRLGQRGARALDALLGKELAVEAGVSPKLLTPPPVKFKPQPKAPTPKTMRPPPVKFKAQAEEVVAPGLLTPPPVRFKPTAAASPAATAPPATGGAGLPPPPIPTGMLARDLEHAYPNPAGMEGELYIPADKVPKGHHQAAARTVKAKALGRILGMEKVDPAAAAKFTEAEWKKWAAEAGVNPPTSAESKALTIAELEKWRAARNK